MPLVKSFKLRFFDDHVRIVVIPGGGRSAAGIDLRGPDAVRVFQSAAPLRTSLEQSGESLRAVSVDLSTQRLTATFEAATAGGKPSVKRLSAVTDWLTHSAQIEAVTQQLEAIVLIRRPLPH